MASGIIHVVLKKVAVIIRRTSKGGYYDLYNLCQGVRPYKANQALISFQDALLQLLIQANEAIFV